MRADYENRSEKRGKQFPGGWSIGDTCVMITNKKKQYTSKYKIVGYDGKYFMVENCGIFYRANISRIFHSREEALISSERRKDQKMSGMKFPSRETVEQVCSQYPAGTRVELVQMDDAQAPPIGTKGTVAGVDDTASIMVKWDNGSSLNVVYGEDTCRKLKTVTTICYGKKDVWDSRKEAREFFLKAMAYSEGSECDRYTRIYTELIMGKSVCTDGEEYK